MTPRGGSSRANPPFGLCSVLASELNIWKPSAPHASAPMKEGQVNHRKSTQAQLTQSAWFARGPRDWM